MRCCSLVSSLARWSGLFLIVGVLVGLAWFVLSPRPAQARLAARQEAKGPDFTGGTGWLNTAGPIRMKDLKGKIVLIDFWTLCCINCIHVLPDLAKLEKKYPNELVVIGVHSAKFDSEKSNESIRKAILRYEISHPVVNDANMEVWKSFGARSWPTLMLIDPEGEVVYRKSGEGQYEDLDEKIAQLIKTHKAKKTLNTRPMKFELARACAGGSPLFFPGKVTVDVPGKRIFIADSTHHRIVITDLDGKKIAIAGTGEPGRKDGTFASATFNDPQGMALKGETLYVADRKNHLIRALDLKAKKVTTVAGTGEQGRDHGGYGDALKLGLNSPWDLLLDGDRLYIAMAGHHQIWAMNTKRGRIAAWAGDGDENIEDDTLDNAKFAQPSGLTTDGKTLFVADSETSAVRSVPMKGRGQVRTLVGQGLFKFGDVDGKAEDVRLQHALGVAYHDGLLYVADTYNSKIKTLDPRTRECKTFLGGEPAGWLATPLFNEPGGICAADGKLYVADTNAHRIRIVDIKKKTVSTLKLQGVEAPKLPGPKD
jgi:thiol-disulfide isomerase/thioredoxin/sugar lactone lactonase YvrE